MPKKSARSASFLKSQFRQMGGANTEHNEQNVIYWDLVSTEQGADTFSKPPNAVEGDFSKPATRLAVCFRGLSTTARQRGSLAFVF